MDICLILNKTLTGATYCHIMNIVVNTDGGF